MTIATIEQQPGCKHCGSRQLVDLWAKREDSPPFMECQDCGEAEEWHIDGHPNPGERAACPACDDAGIISLPIIDGDSCDYPCPCCHPWGQRGAKSFGFPGLLRRRGDTPEDHTWWIEPAEPGMPAQMVRVVP